MPARPPAQAAAPLESGPAPRRDLPLDHTLGTGLHHRTHQVPHLNWPYGVPTGYRPVGRGRLSRACWCCVGMIPVRPIPADVEADAALADAARPVRVVRPSRLPPVSQWGFPPAPGLAAGGGATTQSATAGGPLAI